jgi:hypothetical protein
MIIRRALTTTADGSLAYEVIVERIGEDIGLPIPVYDLLVRGIAVDGEIWSHPMGTITNPRIMTKVDWRQHLVEERMAVCGWKKLRKVLPCVGELFFLWLDTKRQ